MGDELKVNVCQRCGRGFVSTATYQDFLRRWGRRVIVPVLCPTCFLEAGPLPKERGQVKWFSPRKHYGFISMESDEDVFFHQQQLVEASGTALETGQPARFHLRHVPKGLEALNVEIKA